MVKSTATATAPTRAMSGTDYRSELMNIESDLRDAIGFSNALLLAAAGCERIDIAAGDALDAIERIARAQRDNLLSILETFDRAFPGK